MDRYHGFWWSPCGTMIVYTEVDENAVPTFDILHQVLFPKYYLRSYFQNSTFFLTLANTAHTDSHICTRLTHYYANTLLR